MQHFSELNLCSALRSNLDKNEFVTPTPVQAQAIPPIMAGRDVVATAHPFGLTNVVRDDVVEPSLDRDAVLAEADPPADFMRTSMRRRAGMR